MKRVPSSLNLVDTNSLFLVTEWARAHAVSPVADRSPIFSYGALLDFLKEQRQTVGRAPSDASLAFVSLDPANRAQQKFPAALERQGYVVERLDFRLLALAPTVTTETERHDRPSGFASVGPNITYVLGLMTGQSAGSTSKPDVIVVSGAFEVYIALTHFVRRTGGRAALCFFRRFLDPRWISAGLLEADSPISFLDLDPVSERLLGLDLAKLSRDTFEGVQSGIDQLF